MKLICSSDLRRVSHINSIIQILWPKLKLSTPLQMPSIFNVMCNVHSQTHESELFPNSWISNPCSLYIEANEFLICRTDFHVQPITLSSACLILLLPHIDIKLIPSDWTTPRFCSHPDILVSFSKPIQFHIFPKS